MPEQILVLGMGDVLRQDAGVGVHALEALYAEHWPDEVVFAHANGLLVQEFGALKGYSAVVVLDGLRGGRLPGTVYCLSEEDLEAGWGEAVSCSREDLLHSLYAAELLGHKPELRVLGMEPEGWDWGPDLSDTTWAAFADFVAQARRELTNLLPLLGPN